MFIRCMSLRHWQKGINAMTKGTIFMSPRELAIHNAAKAGIADREAGLTPDSSRYDALPGSAWDEWYLQGYAS